MPFTELDSDAYSKFYRYQAYLLEQIFVQDQREQVFLLNAYQQIQKLQLPNVVKYYEIEYNHQEKCVEVLRKYYHQKLFDSKLNDKQAIISLTQQFFQTLATLEGYGIFLLGLKPSNIFVSDGTLYFSGFVRSDKFLLASPIYQSQHLRSFIQDCIANQKYNINSRYQLKSHSMCYSAIVILIQFLLAEEHTEQIANLVRWLDAGNDSLKSVPTTEELLNKIELKYDAMRVIIEQAKILLVNEIYDPTNEIAIQLMSLSTELNLQQNIILLGDLYFPKQKLEQKVELQINSKQPEQQIKQQQSKQKQQPKRCGGGFFVKPKK